MLWTILQLRKHTVSTRFNRLQQADRKRFNKNPLGSTEFHKVQQALTPGLGHSINLLIRRRLTPILLPKTAVVRQNVIRQQNERIRDLIVRAKRDRCGLRGRISDRGHRLTGVDKFRPKRRNPSTKNGTVRLKRLGRSDGADRLTLRVQSPDHSTRNATCHPEFLCRAPDGFGLRDSSGHTLRGAASSDSH